MQQSFFGDSESFETFQARSSAQGRLVHQAAWDFLSSAGFQLETERYELRALGVEVNLVVKDVHGTRWFVEVTGAHGSKRPGLDRTDTVRKILGSAQLLAKWRFRPFLILTTNLPKPGGRGERMIRAGGPEATFDVIVIGDRGGLKRLSEYATSGPEVGPRPGWWHESEIKDRLRPSYEEAIGPIVRDSSLEFPILAAERSIVEALRHHLKLLVPSRDSAGSSLPLAVRGKFLDDILHWLSGRNGGLVKQSADGSWISPSGAAADEHLTVIESWCRDEFRLDEIQPFIERMHSELDQEAVSVVLDGQMMVLHRSTAGSHRKSR